MIHFSTGMNSSADSIDHWRDIYARHLLKVDLTVVGDAPFTSTFTLQQFGDVGVVAGQCSGAVFHRRAEMIDSDDLLLMIHLGAAGGAVQGHRETSLRPGDATLLSGADTGESIHPEGVEFLNLRLPLRAMNALTAEIGEALVRPIPRENPALVLLTHYIRILARDGFVQAEGLGRSIARHICDLSALAIDPGPRSARATRASLGRVRLQAIKSDLREHLGWNGVSIGWAAARQRVSPGYVRKLFASEHGSFSDFLLQERLSAARQRLEDHRLAGRTISYIAYGCGFGDLSYFNRCFRRRYGATPSDIRALALERRMD